MAYHDEEQMTSDVYVPPDAEAAEYISREVKRADGQLGSLTRKRDELQKELAIVERAIGLWDVVHNNMLTIQSGLNSDSQVKAVASMPRQSGARTDGGYYE